MCSIRGHLRAGQQTQENFHGGFTLFCQRRFNTDTPENLMGIGENVIGRGW